MSERPGRVYIATSLDGFIARLDGGVDWLPHPEGDEDFGYGAFMASVDALVMGRNTFELVLSFEGDWPYGDKPVVVLSRSLTTESLPERLRGKVEVMEGEPTELVAALAGRGWSRLYVDGGVTVQGFLRAGLVEELILTRIPVLLGEGIPLFGPLEGDLHLEHVETRAFEGGMVQSRYRVLPRS